MNEKTRARELDFRTLFEAAPGLYLVLLPDLTIVAASAAYLKATQTEREKIVGRPLFEVFPDNPDDLQATGVGNLRASLMRVLSLRVPDTMAVQKYDIRRPDGTFEERYWSPFNVPVLSADGAVRFIIHRVEDVTEFVQLERRGTDAEERAGRMELELYHRAAELQETNRKLREAEAATRRANEALEHRVEQRTHALAEANASLKVEMADRERAEERFRQAQKMEALGQLAGGVAHDFNNLLTVILSFSRLVRKDLGPNHSSAADLLEIEQAAERAASLTRHLLAFSRKHTVAPEVLSLNTLATEAERMLRRLLGEHIDLVFRLAPELGLVKLDRGHFEQVLMNLLVNARDAMPNGGKLTVETCDVDLDASYARGHLGAKPGPYVMLAVTDTGVGMEAQTQEKIFQPFFTTKEVGKGTGLGLAMVHGVVKQAGGEIYVYSAPGKGTTFKLYFPRLSQPDAARVQPKDGPSRGGTETVLLVEDEPAVRAAAERVLTGAGYSVIAAEGPAAAVALCETRAPHFHVLISDVVMPGMDGPTLVQTLRQKYPALRVLYMSGYTGGALLHQGVLDDELSYLQKPFTPELLLGKVRQVLDRP